MPSPGGLRWGPSPRSIIPSGAAPHRWSAETISGRGSTAGGAQGWEVLAASGVAPRPLGAVIGNALAARTVQVVGSVPFSSP